MLGFHRQSTALQRPLHVYLRADQQQWVLHRGLLGITGAKVHDGDQFEAPLLCQLVVVAVVAEVDSSGGDGGGGNSVGAHQSWILEWRPTLRWQLRGGGA